MPFLEMEQLERAEEPCLPGLSRMCAACGEAGATGSQGSPVGKEGSPCGTDALALRCHMSQGVPSMLPEDVFSICPGGLPPRAPCPLPLLRVSHCASS